MTAAHFNTPVTPSRLAFADAIRALAALWVVLFHLSEGKHLEQLRTVVPAPVYAVVFDWGHLGVAAFFCLSGFVMMLTLPQGIQTTKAFLVFVARRLIRLSPPYYFAILLSLGCVWLKAQAMHLPAEYPGLLNIGSHLLYLQGVLGQQNINSVFWTLCIELQFYIAFGVVLLAAACVRPIVRLHNVSQWFLVATAWISMAYPLGYCSFVPVGSFLPFWFAFAVGAMAHIASKEGGALKVCSGMYLLALFVLSLWQQSGFGLMAASTAFCLMVSNGAPLLNKVSSWRGLSFLAAISYSLYLLHNPVTGAVANLVRRFIGFSVVADMAVMTLTVVASILVAWLAYVFVEVPSVRWSRNISLVKQEK